MKGLKKLFSCCFPSLKKVSPNEMIELKPATTPDKVSTLNLSSPTLQVDLIKECKPFMISVAGGAASGKKEICQIVLANIKSHDTTGLKCVHIRLEDFYKELTLAELLLANEGEYNFDHPNAIDFDLFKKVMIDITNGKSVEIPIYDFANFKRLVRLIRLEETITCDKPDVVIISGLLMLYMKEIRDMFDLKVFTDVDSDTRLSRAVVRDTTQRYNKTLDQVLHGYIKFVKPSFEEFVMHTKKHADVIIPRGDGNLVAIELLSEHIVGLLQK